MEAWRNSPICHQIPLYGWPVKRAASFSKYLSPLRHADLSIAEMPVVPTRNTTLVLLGEIDLTDTSKRKPNFGPVRNRSTPRSLDALSRLKELRATSVAAVQTLAAGRLNSRSCSTAANVGSPASITNKRARNTRITERPV